MATGSVPRACRRSRTADWASAAAADFWRRSTASAGALAGVSMPINPDLLAFFKR
ncbi:hypothetical protein [Variovorax atrisoli]|uniref:hypothetical protein n=1 Tax=Variovorax atrisoli TaxID=3394203 RepID=UPI001FCA027B|nr:hypothetical protein [Variovorax paradoxus]